MAIGSDGEVGTVFKSCREFTQQDWEDWYQYIRENWHPYLMAGYATLVHHKDNRFYKGERSKTND